MMDDLMYGHGSVGGPFTLTDQTGKQRSDTDFRGKLMIVYFGYGASCKRKGAPFVWSASSLVQAMISAESPPRTNHSE